MGWAARDIPDQTGRVALVTGANSGIGLEAARELAARGARVVLGCRDAAKAQAAQQDLAAAGGDVHVLVLDVSSLDSVRSAAARFLDEWDRLDLLVNNAGIMAVPYQKTADGFELQLATNHFGHFALTGLLLERLRAVAGSRVVNISSGGHRMGRFDWDDLALERGYGRWRAYGRSKLANLLFTYELHRRLAAAGDGMLAVAAHPGASATNLGRRPPGSERAWVDPLVRGFAERLTQSPAMGALPTLRAATDAGVQGGDYFGPDGFGEIRGHPVRVESNARSKDQALARRLWDVSESSTGVNYGFAPA